MTVAPALIVLASALGGIAWAAQGGGPGAYRALWWTAGGSAICFLGALGAGAPAWRRWWFGFAAAHAVHLGAIAWFVAGVGGRPSWIGLALGAPAYGALAIATWSVWRSGRDAADPWVRFAAPYLWLVFVLTYGAHAVEHGGAHRWSALAALFALPAWRAFAGSARVAAP